MKVLDKEMDSSTIFARRMKRITTGEQVARELRDRILKGELRPGTIIQELDLAAQFGVSRNTFREAVRILAHEGLLRHNLHHGVTVTLLAEEDVSDIYRARLALELAAVEASKGAGREQLKDLAETVVELKRAAEAQDWSRAADVDMWFHRRLISFLGSRRVDRLAESLLGELRLGWILQDSQSSASNSIHWVEQHQKLFELLVAGKQNECQKALRAHLVDAERRLKTIISTSSGSAVAVPTRS